jgi:hypothetical protein
LSLVYKAGQTISIHKQKQTMSHIEQLHGRHEFLALKKYSRSSKKKEIKIECWNPLLRRLMYEFADANFIKHKTESTDRFYETKRMYKCNCYSGCGIWLNYEDTERESLRWKIVTFSKPKYHACRESNICEICITMRKSKNNKAGIIMAQNMMKNMLDSDVLIVTIY